MALRKKRRKLSIARNTVLISHLPLVLTERYWKSRKVTFISWKMMIMDDDDDDYYYHYYYYYYDDYYNYYYKYLLG